jgi:hypothetical protein
VAFALGNICLHADKHLTNNLNLIMSIPIPPLKKFFTLSPFEGILDNLEIVYDGLVERLKVAAVVL